MSRTVVTKNIKLFRNKQKLTQEDLSIKSSVKYTTLIKLESGFHKNPRMDTLIKLADALDVINPAIK